MQGSFEIICRCQPDGTTAIGHQAVSSPWHLSKPYWDGHILLVQAVNSTAGIFSGDHLTLDVSVNEEASVLLTSPSASRIHTMHHGEASLKQKITVSNQAWLEWMPELFIPQKGCRYRQSTEIHAERGASVYAVETLAPGRVAHGEQFAFDRVEWSTRIMYDGKLILAERYPLTPQNLSLQDLMRDGRARYFANALLIHSGELPFREWQHTLQQMISPPVQLGATQLTPELYVFRLVTDNSEQLKETLRQLRSLLAGHIPPLRQSARKL